ncbi:hypothetical protein [Curtobacterium sp. 9128]|nr:hypothetical protein [Curtobacterium sp. 9128]
MTLSDAVDVDGWQQLADSIGVLNRVAERDRAVGGVDVGKVVVRSPVQD